MDKTITLNNNHQMPIIGLGTWRSSKDQVGEAVKHAILNCDYRHIDCASIYGNEKQIGVAFNEIFSSNQAKREDVFVTSKLWNTDHDPANVETACRRTLSDLQLQYLDLYLIHWGIAFKHGGVTEPLDSNGMVKTEAVSTHQTWQAMEKLVKKGLVKSIGVANFTTAMIVDLLSFAKIKPVINQIEIHPYNAQFELVEYCHKQNIAVTAYSPLGSQKSVLSRQPRLLKDQIIIQIAAAHHKTPAQVLIRWSLQRGLITIPKSTHLKRIAENMEVFDFKLSTSEMKKINSLNINHRFVDPVVWWGVPYFR